MPPGRARLCSFAAAAQGARPRRGVPARTVFSLEQFDTSIRRDRTGKSPQMPAENQRLSRRQQATVRQLTAAPPRTSLKKCAPHSIRWQATKTTSRRNSQRPLRIEHHQGQGQAGGRGRVAGRKALRHAAQRQPAAERSSTRRRGNRRPAAASAPGASWRRWPPGRKAPRRPAPTTAPAAGADRAGKCATRTTERHHRHVQRSAQMSSGSCRKRGTLAGHAPLGQAAIHAECGRGRQQKPQVQQPQAALGQIATAARRQSQSDGRPVPIFAAALRSADQSPRGAVGQRQQADHYARGQDNRRPRRPRHNEPGRMAPSWPRLGPLSAQHGGKHRDPADEPGGEEGVRDEPLELFGSGKSKLGHRCPASSGPGTLSLATLPASSCRWMSSPRCKRGALLAGRNFFKFAQSSISQTIAAGQGSWQRFAVGCLRAATAARRQSREEKKAVDSPYIGPGPTTCVRRDRRSARSRARRLISLGFS